MFHLTLAQQGLPPKKKYLGLETSPVNSFTNYQRLACLITISTPLKDYVVDCLGLKNKIVKELTKNFANPFLLKITFCGRVEDVLIVSLGKDFDILRAVIEDSGSTAATH
ncbi:unnamed protein product [Allacma fusca]|uniref:Uncharacterized protein n=1 Tax=Allacma fusca TaxID=39272 RepID=A0A8J2PY79_9HEXA|nr:unnamed protein product [Allacma fusca]